MIIKAAYEKCCCSDNDGLEIVEAHPKREIVRCQVDGESLTVTLLLNKNVNVDYCEEITVGDCGNIFSPAEVAEFVRAVNDTNELHKGTRPLVPGLLILERLLELPEFALADKIELRFVKGLYTGVPWRLEFSAGNDFVLRGREIYVKGIYFEGGINYEK